MAEHLVPFRYSLNDNSNWEPFDGDEGWAAVNCLSPVIID